MRDRDGASCGSIVGGHGYAVSLLSVKVVSERGSGTDKGESATATRCNGASCGIALYSRDTILIVALFYDS